MRTTVTLDDDVAALIEGECQRTGETFRQALNRLLRRAAHSTRERSPDLPLLPGGPKIAIADVSAVLGALDDDEIARRGLYR